MIRLKVSTEFAGRFQKYLLSGEYKDTFSYSKSEYWQYHSRMADIKIENDSIILDGKSGFYFPPRARLSDSGANLFLTLKRKYGKLFTVLKNRLILHSSEPRSFDYFTAFDKVMNHHPISDHDLASYRINFRELQKKSNSIKSINEMKKEFFAKNKYKLHDNMIKAYYHFNILNGYTNLDSLKVILEIGAGNGNFSSLLYYTIPNSTVLIVDLPETLCFSMPFIAELFPDARLLMPHEADDFNAGNYNFVFLTPKQINRIKDNSVDLAINAESFQEMTKRQIVEYFELIQRSGKNNSYFFTTNRVEKIPRGPESYVKETIELPNRFSEYPWNSKNEVLIYEICKLKRLVQLDNIYMRLERLKK